MILARDPSGINRGLVEIIAREASIPTGTLLVATTRRDSPPLASSLCAT